MENLQSKLNEYVGHSHMHTGPSRMAGNQGGAYLVGPKWYVALFCIQKGSDELFINKLLQGKGNDLIHSLNLTLQTLIYIDNDKFKLELHDESTRLMLY